MNRKEEVFKVFEFEFICNNKSDFKDLVIAKNIEEAKKYYIEETYCGSLDGYKIKQFNQGQLEHLYLCDENETQPDPEEEYYNEEDYCGGYKITSTLKDYLRYNQFTHIIE